MLDLVRQGLTNEQIAEQLRISVATAKFHVGEIMGKLGVESRKEAAAWPGRPRAAFGFVGRLLRVRTIALAVLGSAVVLSLILLAGVFLMNRRNGAPVQSEVGPAPTSTPEPVTQTKVIEFQPPTTTASTVQGGTCDVHSYFLGRDDAWRCESSTGTKDPCFGKVGDTQVDCWDHPLPVGGVPENGVTLVLDSPLVEPVPGFHPTETPDRAWWMQTADGTMCGYKATGTVAAAVGGTPVTFLCDDGTGLLGLPTPGKVWTAVSVPGDIGLVPPGTVVPETIVQLRTVWR